MKTLPWLLLTLCLVLPAAAQEPEEQKPPEDPIYDRPFISAFGGGRTAVGGYLEGNTNYFSEDGVSEGFSMELRRFNLFLYSAIGSRITFFSELEFEHGTEEISLEIALIDFEISPALILRGGIILPPLGTFNQNHDSPKWDFIDRPLVSTQIIPSTLSEVGFGVHGQFFSNTLTVGYLMRFRREEVGRIDPVGDAGDAVAIGIVGVGQGQQRGVLDGFEEAQAGHSGRHQPGHAGGFVGDDLGGIAGNGSMLQLRAAVREHRVEGLAVVAAEAGERRHRMALAVADVATLAGSGDEQRSEAVGGAEDAGKLFIAGQMRRQLRGRQVQDGFSQHRLRLGR